MYIKCLVDCQDAVLMVKDIIVIYRKNETILVLISLETLFFAS